MNSIIFILLTATLCLHFAHASSLAEQENKNAKEDSDSLKTTIESGGALYLGSIGRIFFVEILLLRDLSFGGG